MLTIDVIARESSNAIRDALSTPPSDAVIAQAFTAAERGTFTDATGTHSRTTLNGGWVGALSITRHADGTAEVQRTWSLTDAQQAASDLTTEAAVRAFAQRLADDVHAKLRQRASRNVGGQIGDFWSVVAGPRAATLDPARPNDPIVVGPLPGVTPQTPPAPTSLGTMLLVGGIFAAGIAALVYSSRK